MHSTITRTALAALLPLGMTLAACSAEPETPTEEASTQNGTLAQAIAGHDDLETLSTALTDAGLSDIFDGAEAYTVLAPTDAAFEALGSRGEALMTDEQRPMLVGTLREHILPGHLTAEAIAKAVEDGGGSASMTTLGGNTVTFGGEAGRLTVSAPDGVTAQLVGGDRNAGNGAVLPIDAVLSGPAAGAQ